MTFFIERFESHPVHDTLNQLIDSIEQVALPDLTVDEVAAIARCQHVAEHAVKMLGSSDPELVAESMLDQLQKAVTNLLQHWDQYCQQRDCQILTQPADEVLKQVAILPANRRRVARQYADPIRILRTRAGEVLQQMRQASVEQRGELDEFSERLAGTEGQLQQFNAQFEQQKGRIDSLVNEQQGAFSQSQDKRQGAFDAFLTERNGEFQTGLADQDQKARATIENLERHREHAEAIVGIIGNIGVTGNYQRIANEEKKTANLFRWLAIGCFGGMMGAVMIVLWISAKSDSFSWGMAWFRTVISLMFAAPASYCAMESSKHRKREKQNRKIELELASLSPFLEKIDDAKAEEIMAALAPQYFGQHVSADDEADLFAQVSQLPQEVLKTLVEVAKVLRK